MAVNHYEVLGVSADASAGEIRAAYVALARRFHPDQHPGASAREAAELNTAMAAVNEAYATLGDPGRRAAYDRELARGVGGNHTGPHPPGAARPARADVPRWPRADECALCGASPAIPVRFEHVHAWVLAATVHTLDAVLCRSCGQSLGRAKQNRTLWAGWWGTLSLFRNVLVVTRNARHLHRLGRLTPPRPSRESLLVPLARPLDPGRAVWLRGACVVLAIVFGVGLLATVTDPGDSGSVHPSGSGGAGTSSSFERTDGTGGRSSTAGWAVGSCVAGTSWVRPVPCSSPNDGEIIAVVSSVSACPYAADSYVEDGEAVWCIAD